MSRPRAAMTLMYAPIATDGSPRSIRWKVTRDMPADSAAAIAVTPNPLRRARILRPSAASLAVATFPARGEEEGISDSHSMHFHAHVQNGKHFRLPLGREGTQNRSG